MSKVNCEVRVEAMNLFFSISERRGEAMDVFLEFLKEIIKAVVRETTAHLFKNKFLDKRKPTLSSSHRKQKKRGFRKTK